MIELYNDDRIKIMRQLIDKGVEIDENYYNIEKDRIENGKN